MAQDAFAFCAIRSFSTNVFYNLYIPNPPS